MNVSEPDQVKLERLKQVIADAAEPKKTEVVCPNCSHRINVEVVAAFKETTLACKYTVANGHRLQARTLGGTMVDMEKLLKAVAKGMGAKVEVLVTGATVTDTEYAVEYVIARQA